MLFYLIAKLKSFLISGHCLYPWQAGYYSCEVPTGWNQDRNHSTRVQHIRFQFYTGSGKADIPHLKWKKTWFSWQLGFNVILYTIAIVRLSGVILLNIKYYFSLYFIINLFYNFYFIIILNQNYAETVCLLHNNSKSCDLINLVHKLRYLLLVCLNEYRFKAGSPALITV